MFPHHECETAQSESVTGEPFVRLWFHVGLVGLDGTKMSKSLGNLVFVGDLCKEWDPAAVRLALLAHHYRQDWDWRTGEDMPAAAARLALWRSAPPATRMWTACVYVGSSGYAGPGRGSRHAGRTAGARRGGDRRPARRRGAGLLGVHSRPTVRPPTGAGSRAGSSTLGRKRCRTRSNPPVRGKGAPWQASLG